MRKLLWAMALASLASAQTTREDLERMALAASPALHQSAAEVRAATGRVKQAGLYPNPMLGFTGDHNTPALDGGSLGGFAEQRFVTGGKLGLDRKVADQDRLGAEEMAKVERLRVIAAIDALYYRGLGRTEAASRCGLVWPQLTQTTAATSRELANLGQADQPDIFEVEIEQQRAQLARHHGAERSGQDVAGDSSPDEPAGPEAFHADRRPGSGGKARPGLNAGAHSHR